MRSLGAGSRTRARAVFCCLVLLGALGASASAGQSQPEPASTPAPAAPVVPPTAPRVGELEQIAEENRRRAEELEDELKALAEEREELAESLRELDERAREAAREREDEIREQTRRLREASEELGRVRAAEAVEEAVRESQEERPDEDNWTDRARQRTPNGKFGFGSTVKVRARETVGDVVVVAGGAKVDGDVYGDVATFGGPAKINGRVSGSVTAIGGDVELGPSARVEGDVNSIGGEIREHSGSYVGGERGGTSASFDFSNFDSFDRGAVGAAFFWADWVQFFWALIFTGFLIILAGVVYLILQRPVERVRDAALNSPMRAFVTGFLVLVLSVPALVAVMVVLAISIVGIPLLVILVVLLPFALIGFILATFYGYTAVALGVGSVLRDQLRLSWASGFAMLAVGVFSLRALGLSGDLLDAIGLPAFLTVLFGFAGFVVQLCALSIAVGAVIISRLGLQPASPAGVVPPPDLPPVPDLDQDDELRIGVDLDPDAESDSDPGPDDWMDEPDERR